MNDGCEMKMKIVSETNARVKQWAQLLQPKGRRKQGKFLVEGVRLVNEALQSHRQLRAEVESVLYSLSSGLPEDVFASNGNIDNIDHIEWIGVSDAVFAKCSDTVNSQGVIAVVKQRHDELDDVLVAKQPLVVAVDGIQDPGNLGTIIRSADAVGATGVVVGKGSVDIYNPKTVRATMGSLFHLPIIEANLEDVLPNVRAHDIDIVSTGLQTDRTCYDEEFNKGMWIVVGNEGHGVSERVAPYVDRQMIIPMVGQAESLNVAMATTVILYEALRQRNYS